MPLGEVRGEVGKPVSGFGAIRKLPMSPPSFRSALKAPVH